MTEKKTSPLLEEDEAVDEETQKSTKGSSKKSAPSKSTKSGIGKATKTAKNDQKPEAPEETQAEEEEVEEETEAPEETQAEEEEVEEETEAPGDDQSAEKKTKPTTRDVGFEYRKMSKEMKDALDKQPRIQFFIPLNENEQPGAWESVQINGHRIVIKKGAMVSIPQQVAEILAEHYRIEMEAGQEYRIDREQATHDALSG